MKKILLTLLSAAALLVCACDKYDDTPLRNELSSLEQRVKNLEDLCSKLNTNIASIQTLMQNIDSKIAIERVVTLPDNEGYLITFSDGASITVYNGLDGKAGGKGDKGDKGDQGDPGEAPAIGVAQEDGVLYWTVNGEWLLDDEGNKIPVVGPKGDQGEQGEQGEPGKNGSNGSNGTNGKNGENGVTPQLKIEDGKWMVSYDNGSSWKEVTTSGDNPYNTMALTIEETEDAYIITLDGESYTISKAAEAAVTFQIKVDSDEVAISGESVKLSYTLTGGDETTHVVAEGSVRAEVDESACTVTIYGDADTEGYVILRAIRNSDGVYSAQYISVSGGVLEILEGESFEVPAAGQDIEVKVKTSMEYDFVDVPDWITVSPETKTVRTEIRTLTVAANNGEERTANFKIKSTDGKFEKGIVVKQEGFKADTLTVAQAIALTTDLTWTDNNTYDSTDEVFVKGKISRIANNGTYTSGGTYGNASYYISDDGTQQNELLCYRILYLGGEKYQAGQTDIKVGDEVIIYGQLMNYKGNTPETVANKAYLYSLNSVDDGGEDEPDDPGEQDGSTISIDFSAQGFENAEEVKELTIQGITITPDKGSGSTTPKYYNTGTALRLYGGNTLTLSSSGNNIEKVEITFSSGEGTNEITADSGDWESPVWTGSASSVTFTVGGTSGHRRVAKIVVTLAE